MKFAHTFTSFKTVFSFCKPWPGTNLLLVLQLRGRGWPLPRLWKSRYHGISSTSSHYISQQEYLRISKPQGAEMTLLSWNYHGEKIKFKFSSHRNERKPLKHFSAPFISRTWWLKKFVKLTVFWRFLFYYSWFIASFVVQNEACYRPSQDSSSSSSIHRSCSKKFFSGVSVFYFCRQKINMN